MPELIINNCVIDTPLDKILKTLKSELTNGKLAKIENKGSSFRVTCPSHKGGTESHPSCNICATNDDKVDFGTFHCFTCGESGPLYHFVAECFDKDDEFGKEWLLERFGNTLVYERVNPLLSDLDLDLSRPSPNKKVDSNKNELLINSMQSWHPYMAKRKLSREICEKFKVKYDANSNCIAFPVYDDKGKLYMLTRRSVEGKQFYIDKDMDKPIYLLYHILNNNIKYAVVCESQINALTLQSLGISAIATFGCNVTKKQFDLLNRSCIRHYIIAFDGDDAGHRGVKKFMNNIRKDVFVDVLKLPQGKDINDLTKEEIVELFEKENLNFEELVELNK